jgi:hypothetical protein
MERIVTVEVWRVLGSVEKVGVLGVMDENETR